MVEPVFGISMNTSLLLLELVKLVYSEMQSSKAFGPLEVPIVVLENSSWQKH